MVLSFWLLVGILLALRETLSEDLGWGFQLQEPVFVFALAVFLLVFAMSLSGVFEIGMSLTGMGSKLTMPADFHHPFFRSFGNRGGHTLHGTPSGRRSWGRFDHGMVTCVYGFYIRGTGFVGPLSNIIDFPQMDEPVAQTGAWMDTFKQAMAFPLYGTVAWLL